MIKTRSYTLWKIIAVLTSVIIFTLSVCSYSSNTTADAISSTRTYWRHDYNSSDLSSYYEYSLTVTSDEAENLVSPMTIFPPNNMVRDYDTSVVRLSIGGTGFIIGEHTIVTAAHCVYDQNNDRFHNITIDIVGSNNEVLESISPKYVHVNKNFTTSNYNENYDYALIYVEEDLSDYGMFYLGTTLDSYISNQGTVTVSGFPQEYPDGYDFNSLGWGIRFKATGNILANNTTSSLIRYNADMTYGDSGGPVYVEEGLSYNGQLYDYKTVVAINVSHLSSYNTGVRITTDLLKFYNGNTYLTA